jgi:rod shape-determining protein MreD
MKGLVYVAFLALLLPVQAGLLALFAIGDVRPDLGLAAVFIIGLLTGPAEATVAGIGIGLLQDIGSASLLGFTGLTHGLVGLGAGLIGTRVLDRSNPFIVIFLALFSVLEGIAISIFLQVTCGDVPFFTLLFSRFIPQAAYTGVLCLILLRIVDRRGVLPLLKRQDIGKETL